MTTRETNGTRESPTRLTVAVVALAAGVAVWTAASVLAPTASAAHDSRLPAGWTEASHGDAAAPDYDRVFAMDRVHEITIVVPTNDFEAMQADLRDIVSQGRGGGIGGRGRAMNNGMPASLISRDPMYVPVTVLSEGQAWSHVGMRYKGNSSLMVSRMSDNGKVPFRLDFDRYEEDVPEIQNQRFHGFAELTFSSNFSDDSQLRELLATEVLRDRGVPAARAAFYRVFVDTGSGPEYWGLYTMVEDPDDGAMLEAQFGSSEGNLYKPDGPGADWTRFDSEGFPKKTNEDVNDFSDVAGAIEALNAPADDPATWRARLESVLEVDGFLRWLAVNTVLENWDAYGAISHNYYLYGDPSDNGRLYWIPWDHNMAFGVGFGFGGRRGGAPGLGRAGAGGRAQELPGGPPPGLRRGGPRGGVGFGLGTAGPDVLHEQVGQEWPLMYRLLADDVYATRYRELLSEAMEGAFDLDAFSARARELHELIAPYVVGAEGERTTHTTLSSPEGFESSVDGPQGLIARVRERQALVRAALGGDPSR